MLTDVLCLLLRVAHCDSAVTGPNRRGCSGTPLITHKPSPTLSAVDAPLFDLSFAFSDSPFLVVLFYLSKIFDTSLKPLHLNWLYKEVSWAFRFLVSLLCRAIPV